MSNLGDEIKWQAEPQDNFERINKVAYIAGGLGILILAGSFALSSNAPNTWSWIGGVIAGIGVLIFAGNTLFNLFKKKPSGQGKL